MGMDKEGKGKEDSKGMLEGVLVVVVCTSDKLEGVLVVVVRTSDKLEGVSWGISDISGKMLEGMLGHHLH